MGKRAVPPSEAVAIILGVLTSINFSFERKVRIYFKILLRMIKISCKYFLLKSIALKSNLVSIPAGFLFCIINGGACIGIEKTLSSSGIISIPLGAFL